MRGYAKPFAVIAALLASSLLGCSSGEAPVAIGGSHAAPEATGTGAYRAPYPDPPYGTVQGAVIEDFRFLGWPNPATAEYEIDRLGAMSLADYYDPDGEKGIEYVVLTSTAVWCSACKYEYQQFAQGIVEDYMARGVVFVGALFEDNDANPARPEDLAAWAQAFDVRFPFVLDPSFKLGAFFDREATPMTMVIDARTMTIVWTEVGWASDGPYSVWAFLDQRLGG